MKKTIRIELNDHTTSAILKALEENLFELEEGYWVYTNDNGEPTMRITYKIEGNEIVFDIWMIDEEMQILLDKALYEIERENKMRT